MTLCLVWKKNGIITVVSDSRLTRPDKTIITDDANKVFKIETVIKGPSFNGKIHTLFRYNYCLCFTGSYLNGSLIADTIEEVLSNLQIVPQLSDYSFSGCIPNCLKVRIKGYIWRKHQNNDKRRIFENISLAI